MASTSIIISAINCTFLEFLVAVSSRQKIHTRSNHLHSQTEKIRLAFNKSKGEASIAFPGTIA